MKTVKLFSMLSIVGFVLATGAAATEHKGSKKSLGSPMKAKLTGASESPGPGDPDGSGEVTMKAEAGQNRLCFKVKVSRIDAPTAAHVHKGVVGQSGPSVLVLSQVLANGSWKNCVDADPELISDILRSPEDYYFNVHNGAYEKGALRGQFAK